MHVIVFGATGNIGSRVTRLLADEGHEVTAFCRHGNIFANDPRIHVHIGDAYDAASVSGAVRGKEAVISALGSWGSQRKNVVSEGMRNIIPAMERTGAERIVSLTGSDARVSGLHQTLLQRLLRPVFSVVAGPILADGEEHIRLLQASQLAWTVIRSPVMRGWGAAGDPTIDMRAPYPWETVHRDTVARAMVSQLHEDARIRSAPYVHG